MIKAGLKALHLPRGLLRRSTSSLSVELELDRMAESDPKTEVTGGDKVSGDYRPDYPWKKVKKCACMLSLSGKNYHGMQRNFDTARGGMVRTIEGEFLAALSKA